MFLERRLIRPPDSRFRARETALLFTYPEMGGKSAHRERFGLSLRQHRIFSGRRFQPVLDSVLYARGGTMPEADRAEFAALAGMREKTIEWPSRLSFRSRRIYLYQRLSRRAEA
jgi:hypothetical protein